METTTRKKRPTIKEEILGVSLMGLGWMVKRLSSYTASITVFIALNFIAVLIAVIGVSIYLGIFR